VPASVIELPGASLPPGFSIIAFAELFRPTALAWDGDGRIYAASQDGTIHLLEDTNGDGRADSDILFSFGFAIPLGITVAPDGETLFVSSNSKISTLRDSDGDKVADEIANFTSGLPVGQHQNNNLKFGPDGQLYIGVGSTCDVCYEIDDRSATIMRFDPVSGAGEVFARGLRNTYDIAFHPFSGELFATDNGRDDLGMDAPKEELNLIGQGLDYGWPDCWDEGEGPRCEGTETAVAFFESHSSANSIDFYAGDRFPPSYRSDQQGAVAYVGIFGSWLKPDVTTGIVRVRLIRGENGYDSEVSWFAQLPGAMPLGLIAGEDGAIYVGDFINDRIFRISYGN
jgi:glucose/arabinose dehydrogenase